MIITDPSGATLDAARQARADQLTAHVRSVRAAYLSLPAAVLELVDLGMSYPEIHAATGVPPATAHRWVRRLRR